MTRIPSAGTGSTYPRPQSRMPGASTEEKTSTSRPPISVGVMSVPAPNAPFLRTYNGATINLVTARLNHNGSAAAIKEWPSRPSTLAHSSA